MSTHAPTSFSETTTANTLITSAGITAALILITMVTYGALTNTSQQTFEMVQPIENYTAALITQAGSLKTIIALDNLFIAAYTLLLLALVIKMRSSNTGLLMYIIIVCGLIAGLLDYAENFHILSMIFSVESKQALSVSQVELQMVLSAIKWHLGYFAFVLIGIAFKATNNIERLFRFSLIFWQMPIGILVYPLWGTAIGDLLFYIRYGNLLIGFVLFALIFRPRSFY